MKIKDLIEELKQFNPEAETSTIVHCRSYPFTLSFGGAEGVTKESTREVYFYVDELCKTENAQN